jgi:hypothetical protein
MPFPWKPDVKANSLTQLCYKSFRIEIRWTDVNSISRHVSKTVDETVKETCGGGRKGDTNHNKTDKWKRMGRNTRESRGTEVYITEHMTIQRWIFNRHCTSSDRLCGLVVRVPGYRSRDPESDSRRYQIFWELVGLEQGALSLVSITEEILEWKSSGCGLENRD